MISNSENSILIKVILLVGGVVGSLAIVWGVLTLSVSSTDDISSDGTYNGEVSETLPSVNEADHIFGEVDAPITIVEYSDFQCPACAQYEPVLKRLIEEYPSDVRVVYRHFPLRSIHANAEPAAQASEAAALQGEFHAYHDELFATQDEWSTLRGGERDEFFVKIAGDLKLDVERFENDFKSSEVQEAVRSDLKSAQDLKLDSTPSLFLNGVRIQNPSGYQAFADLIEAEIERVKATESGESIESSSDTQTDTE
jgi:protein-disulfide isomerase